MPPNARKCSYLDRTVRICSDESWPRPIEAIPLEKKTSEKNIGIIFRDELHFQMISFVDSIKSLTPAACIWLK